MSVVSILPGAARAIAAVAVPAGNAALGMAGSFASLLASASQGGAEQADASPATSSQRLAAQQRLAASLTESGEPSIDLADLRHRADEALLQLDDELRQRIGEAGIELGTGISFQMSLGEGRITVSDDHPQRDAIERLLNDGSPLADALRKLASTLDLLRAAEDHREFAESYEQDPLTALEQFSHLFDDSQTPAVEFLIDAFDVRASLV